MSKRRPSNNAPDAIVIATLLATIKHPPAQRARRVRYRLEALAIRLEARKVQSAERLADAVAKLSGGSLLTATLLLIVNGQAAVPVIVTSSIALLVFVGSTIYLMWSDRRSAELQHGADLIEAALEEAER